MKNSSSVRVNLVSLLTAVFVFIVLLIHQGNYVYNVIPPVLRLLLQIRLPFFGSFTFAVAGFFFLSGYKLALSKTPFSFSSFWRRRAVRIYPFYFIAVLLFALLINRHSSLADIFIHLLALQSLFPNLFGPNFLTLYFVGLLFLFYLNFSLTIKYLDKQLTFFLIQLSVYVLALVFHFLRPFGITFFDVTFFGYFWFFILGMLSARYFPLPQSVSLPGKTLAKLVIFMDFASYPVYLYHRVYMQLISMIISPNFLRWFLTVVVGFPIIYLAGYYLQLAYNRLFTRDL